jgi:branched-chain amino acid transport system permease protein
MSLDALTAGAQALGPLLFDLGIGALLALSVALPLSCGVLSLASAAFMGLGAWCASLLSFNTDLPFAAVVLAGTLAPVVLAAGIGLPLLRLGSTRFALVTLALGEGLHRLALRLEISGGAAGLQGIPARSEGWQLLVALAVVLVVLHRLQGSRFGRACAAACQEDVAAATSGIDVVAIRLGAFCGSAAIAGLAGSLQAHHALVLRPDDFGFEAMLGYLGMALLGGSTDLMGPLLGATLLAPWSSLLHDLAGLRSAFGGVILMAVMLFLPRGLLGPLRRLWSRA